MRVERQIRAAAQIERAQNQRLVHRKDPAAVADDPLLVTDGLRYRLAENDADVLDRVVVVDLKIAVAFYGQVEQAVPGESVQHVVEEPYARVDLRDSAPVQIQLDLDARLRGVSLNFRYPCHGSSSARACHFPANA